MDESLIVPHQTGWWRFSDYVVDGGSLKPKHDAVLEAFDPGGVDSTAAPYKQIANLLSNIRVERDRETGLLQVVDKIEHLLQWCRRYGLPGTLLQRCHVISLAPSGLLLPASDPVLVLEASSFVRSGALWEEVVWRRAYRRKEIPDFLKRLVEQGLLASADWQVLEDAQTNARPLSAKDLVDSQALDLVPDVPHPRVLITDFTPTFHTGHSALTLREETLDTTLGRFFPSIDPGMLQYCGLPAPLSGEFWRLYAEPLDDFIAAAYSFTEALSQLRLVRDEQYVAADDRTSQLNSLLAGVQPRLGFDGSQYRAEWSFTSMWAWAAKGALDQLGAGRRVGICEACETPFITSREETLYCSDRCRHRIQKREQRRRSKEKNARNDPPATPQKEINDDT
jgi:hypothetical protein